MEYLNFKGFPPLRDPVMVAGFDGWPNAGELATATVKYLARALKSFSAAEVDMDGFLTFTESRPSVTIERGVLAEMARPRGFFWAARTQGGPPDIIFYHSPEPQVRWNEMSNAILNVAEVAGVKKMVLLGGMQDHILHTDVIVSGVATSEELLKTIRGLGVTAIEYQGPAAFHGALMADGLKKGIQSLSLWGHSPVYLKGKFYPGMIRMVEHLNMLLSKNVEPDDLRDMAREQAIQVEKLIEENKELKSLVESLKEEGEKKDHLH